MGKQEQYTAKQFIAAMDGSGGIIATIATRVGCTWVTAKKYIDKYPTIQRAYQNERSKVDDLAVSTIIKAIKKGDVKTAKWWLARMRREEFGDNVDLTTDQGPITFTVKYDSDQEQSITRSKDAEL